MNLESIVKDFTSKIIAAAREEIHAEVMSKLGGANGVSKARASRRKGPIQLCPAPGCTKRAAPVFGMVCGDHKGTPKATIAKWREARRAKQAKNGATASRKPVKAKTATKKN